MAKIGNETKLVLKLAEATAKSIKSQVRKFNSVDGVKIQDAESYVKGVERMEHLLEGIVSQLESGK